MSKFFQASLKKEKTLNITRDNEPPITHKRKNTKKFMISPVKNPKNEKYINFNEINKSEKSYKTNNCLISNNYNEKHVFNIVNKNSINTENTNSNNSIIDNINEIDSNYTNTSQIAYNCLTKKSKISTKQNDQFNIYNIVEHNITPSFHDENIYNCVSPLYSNTDISYKNNNISSMLFNNDLNTDKNNSNKITIEHPLNNIQNKTNLENEGSVQMTTEGSSQLEHSTNRILSPKGSVDEGPSSRILEQNFKKSIYSSLNENVPYNTKINYTSINKLNFSSLQEQPTLTYIQKDKIKLYNYNIMLDTSTKTFIKNDCTPCFYCRRKFDFVPLGLPIKYYPSLYILNNNYLQICKYSFNYKENSVKLNKNERTRLLEILKNNSNFEKLSFNLSQDIQNNLELNECNNYLKDSVSKETDKNSIKKNIDNCDINNNRYHKILTKDFFETDGVFCSFNCIVSFIEENSYNPLYQNSNHLIYLMYKHIFGQFPNKSFIRSPSWKLRKEYGGILSDDDYDKFVQTVPIIESKQTKSTSNQLKSEIIFEILI